MTLLLLLLASVTTPDIPRTVRWSAPEEKLLVVFTLPNGAADVHYNPEKVYQQVVTEGRIASLPYAVTITFIEIRKNLRPEEAATEWGWRSIDRIYAYDRIVWQDERIDKRQGKAFLLEIREAAPGEYLIVLKVLERAEVEQVNKEVK